MKITLLAALVVFLVVVLLLVALLLVLMENLVPQGDVTVTVNGDKQLTVPMGGTLISTLAEQQVYLPSACGGKGSCGQCRCRVLEGGGAVLPTELPHLSRREVLDHWRLGCQVKVKGPMQIQLPESVLSVKKWEGEVVSTRNVATFIREIVMRLPQGERLDFLSGSYIQVDVPKLVVDHRDILVDDAYRGDWQRLGLFSLVMRNDEPCTRAYSMANHPAEGDVVMLNVRIATPPPDRVHGGFQRLNPGVCSSYMWSLRPGDKVTLSGPYGEFHVLPSDREMMFIGGGAGMAPMRSHIFDLFLTQHTQRKVTFWYGGRSLKELFYTEEFENLAQEHDNFDFHVALSEPLEEDHWTGPKGFIHQVIFDSYLGSHPEPEEIEYYLCGPGPMTNAVVKMLDALGVPKQNIFFDDFGA